MVSYQYEKLSYHNDFIFVADFIGWSGYLDPQRII